VLILTRKVEQGIVIDGNIIVRVLAVDGERVKLGIVAPTTIAVLREELLQEVAGENREAASPPPGQGSQLAHRLRQLEGGRQQTPPTGQQ
jgi:carbon storage regulator